MNWNKFLDKHIRNHLSPELLEKEDMRRFLNAVNNSYNSYERDRDLSAHAFRISEQEYAAVNQRLHEEIQLKQLGIKNLKEAIRNIDPDKEEFKGLEEEDNLMFVLSYLTESVNRQKKMETELKDSSDRLSATAKTFSQLIKNLHNGIVVEDANRRIVLTNQLFCNIFGISLQPDMMIGMDCADSAALCKHLFRDPEKFTERMQVILSNKELVIGEELEMADGRILLRDYIPITVDAVYKGNLWKFEDVTREKETQTTLQRLSLVASANENGVVFTDAAGIITWANEGFSRMTGYSPDEMAGKTPIELCKGPLSEKDSLRAMLDLFYSGKSFHVEVAHYRKDGSWFWGKAKGQAVLDEKGGIFRYFAIIEDISCQKQMEKDLIEAKELAEDSSRAKEAFLANMSHEIRTPMNAILGMSRQLKKTLLNSQQSLFLETITTAAENLLVVINDILDITKIEAGKLALETVGFRMKDVLAKITGVMYYKAEEKGLRLSYSLDASINDVLLGDSHRLNQILLNLVSNAVKFTAAGSVTIHGAAMRTDEHSQTIRLIIKDTGIGMEEEFLKNLFQKFTQEDRSVARKYGGSGLGMSICKQLTELMKGHISVNSRKGEGTEVILIIPFGLGHPRDLLRDQEESIDEGILEGSRILLVEDNEMNRLVATTVLGNYGAKVSEACDGAQALDMLKREPFDLVLMDIQMPVMDGWEATRRIRCEMGSALPVIALTANAIKGENEKCMSAGMNDYVSKPFEEDTLVRKIAGWLQKKLPAESISPIGEDKILSRPTPALYDLSKLKAVGRNNDGFMRRMITMFIQQVPAETDAIRAAYEMNKLDVVRSVAHKMKPVLDGLSIDILKEEMIRIEKLAAAGQRCEQLDQSIVKLERVIGQVVTELKGLTTGS